MAFKTSPKYTLDSALFSDNRYFIYLHEVGVLKDLFWEIAQIPIFVCVGALLHIIEDGICGKVPLIWRKRKIGIKLFRVGSSWEYFISYTICVAALYYKFML